MAVDWMLAKSCDVMGVGFMKSTIAHDMAGMACFVREQFETRIVFEYHSGTLMYTNFYRDKRVERRYGEEVMSMSAR